MESVVIHEVMPDVSIRSSGTDGEYVVLEVAVARDPVGTEYQNLAPELCRLYGPASAQECVDALPAIQSWPPVNPIVIRREWVVLQLQDLP